MPDHWIGAAAGTETPQDLVKWWTTFGDPNLTSIMDRAIKSNLDLQVAQARVRQARASLGLTSAGFWPTLETTGSFTRGRSTGAKAISNMFQAGLDAVWEMDVFGGTRRNIEAAQADFQAAIESQRDVIVTLTAEVALNYLNLRGYQQQISIAQNNLKLQQHTAKITREKHQAEFVSGLDVANADALVATTASQIPVLETAERQAIYNLSILLGQEPAALVKELSIPSNIPAAPPTVPLSVPSELLRRRPDIRQAEAQAHAATARIGVAEADLFPKVSLSGSMGMLNSRFESLTDGKSQSWSFGPSISWPIFDAGRIGSNIKLQKALEEESVIAYHKIVLTALQEVENALIASTKEQEHRNLLIEAVNNNRKAVDLSTQLYTEGQSDFLNVLQAQRELFSTEDALVQSTRNVSTNLVALYKALGGGWSEESKK
jgi:NodT family efflux transporter outer membrane factor (OMF) lipoprotein